MTIWLRETDEDPMQPITRRKAISLIAVTATGVAVSRGAFAAESVTPLLNGADVCVFTPETTEGPYYFDPQLERADITEGRPGLPTTVRLQVVDAQCKPMAGARVDIWHCDASGIYSGYARQTGGADATGETFMRGTQFANADGIVEFETTYPGWYRGRTTHIHFKVFLDRQTLLTGQLFFPEDVNEKVYASAPYNARNETRDTFNDGDNIARQAGAASVAAVEELPERYLAQMIIGVA
jgi:protocatechuate 3,4-dioxygenase beta subunit